MKRSLLTIVLAVAALLACAGPAGADGDPASDYLLVQDTFLGVDVQDVSEQGLQLAALARAAGKRDYKIRIAVITQEYDLGIVTSLWRKPTRYAPFLGLELSEVYGGRLLVVMPNGFGFYHHKKGPTAAEKRVLAALRAPGEPSRMLGAAIAAVRRLAATEGVRLAVPKVKIPPATATPTPVPSVHGTQVQDLPNFRETVTPSPPREDAGGGGGGLGTFTKISFALTVLLLIAYLVTRYRERRG